MTRTLLLVIGVAGCGGPSAPAPVPNAPRVSAAPTLPADTYCPAWLSIRPWANEMFPACPPAWFLAEDVRICDGPCPKPCEIQNYSTDVFGNRAAAARWNHHYDARGRFTHLDVEYDYDTETSGAYQCQYTGDDLMGCSWGVGDVAKRDERNRIIEIGPGPYDQPLLITYDDTGRVAAIGDERLVYDARGRLVRTEIHRMDQSWHETELERNVSGQVVEERGRLVTRRFTYDARNRVVKVVTDIKKDDLGFSQPGVTSDEYTYDGDRLVRVVHDGKFKRDREYKYECK
jgi:hypothetical protein